jgi:NAD(P)-dependent dehydrogenase (short-subunit alcohol dehydrogenase family)
MQDHRQLEGKVAVITGGASGIGERTAALFVEHGARVVIADMQRERGERVAAELGDAACFAYSEVSREGDVQTAVERALGEYGRLDCMFNNAGFGGALGPIAETDVEDWDITFAVLVRGVMLGMKHAAAALRKTGAEGGSIISTASVAGLQAGLSPHAYAAAKAAVVHLTRSVALELAAERIRVNCICPGFIATPLSTNSVGGDAQAVEDGKHAMVGAQPIQRAGEPEDIAQAALWLASDHSSFVTGQAIVVDGGICAGRPWEKQPGFFRRQRPITVYRPD